MEEKILIQEAATKEYTKQVICVTIVSIILFILSIFYANYQLNNIYSEDKDVYTSIIMSVLLGCSVILGLLEYLFSKCKITVTNYRVYGKTIVGQVDLPLDSISSVNKGIFKSLGVATSSGLVKFYSLKSRDRIYEVISSLLKERQESKTTIKEETATSSIDELKKLKELFDMGIISQEEFDTKKKQLLGL